MLIGNVIKIMKLCYSAECIHNTLNKCYVLSFWWPWWDVTKFNKCTMKQESTSCSGSQLQDNAMIWLPPVSTRPHYTLSPETSHEQINRTSQNKPHQGHKRKPRSTICLMFSPEMSGCMNKTAVSLSPCLPVSQSPCLPSRVGMTQWELSLEKPGEGGSYQGYTEGVDRKCLMGHKHNPGSCYWDIRHMCLCYIVCAHVRYIPP